MSIFGNRKQQPVPPTTAEPASPLPAAQPSRQPVGFETVLGAGATLKGDLKSQSNVRLDGSFEGTLEIEGNVLIGETAKIMADIHAKNVAIAGAVRGNVSGKKVQILRTGRVWGDISAAAIATEEGAFIDGKITMLSHESAAQIFDPAALALPEELKLEEKIATPPIDVKEPESEPEPELEPEPEPELALPEEDEEEEIKPEAHGDAPE